MNDTSEHLPPAPLLKRLFALGYDLFILCALSMGYAAAATVVMVFGFGIQDSGDYRPMQEGVGFQFGWVLTLVAFYWFFWRRAGQTVGMKAWHLKIVTKDGGRPSHAQIAIRVLIGPIALAAGGLGYFWCLFNKDKAAWQDLASNTRVVQTPKIKKEKK